MSPALVIGAAPHPEAGAFYRELLAGAENVVAADGGAEWCVSLGRVPDLAIGDFDSAVPGAVERLRTRGVEVLAHPRDKDETDLELAVAIALERFGAPVALSAAYTGRIDHTLAAVGALLRAGAGATVREPGWSMHVATPDQALELRPRPGALFSVLAVGAARAVNVSGGRWPLVDAALPAMGGVGISNVTCGNIVRVSVGDGTLVVVVMDAPAPADASPARAAEGGGA